MKEGSGYQVLFETLTGAMAQLVEKRAAAIEDLANLPPPVRWPEDRITSTPFGPREKAGYRLRNSAQQLEHLANALADIARAASSEGEPMLDEDT